MTLAPYVGTVASILTTISFFPQVYKIYKEKSAEDISMACFVIIFASTLAWMLYGYLYTLYSVILTNAILSVFSALIIASKFIFAKKTE